MTNRTVELILQMRDNATATWNSFQTRVRSGAGSMFSWMSKNWLSVGATIAGSFYVAVKALDKLEHLAMKADRAISSIGGKGGVEAVEQVKLLAGWLEKIKGLADEGLVRLGLFAVGIGNSIAHAFAKTFLVIINMFAAIEQGMNLLGLTQSHYFQILAVEGAHKVEKFAQDAAKAFGAMLASSKDLGLGIVTLRERVDKLKKEFEAMDPTMKGYREKYLELQRAQEELDSATLKALWGHKMTGEVFKANLAVFDRYVKEQQKAMMLALFFTKEMAQFSGQVKPEPIKMDEFASTKFMEKLSSEIEVFDDTWKFALRNLDGASMRAADNFYQFFKGKIEGVSGLIDGLVQSIADQFTELLAELAAKGFFSLIAGLLVPSVGVGGFFSALTGGLFDKSAASPSSTSRTNLGMQQSVGYSRSPVPIVVQFNIKANDAKSFSDMIRQPEHRNSMVAVLNDVVRKSKNI